MIEFWFLQNRFHCNKGYSATYTSIFKESLSSAPSTPMSKRIRDSAQILSLSSGQRSIDLFHSQCASWLCKVAWNIDHVLRTFWNDLTGQTASSVIISSSVIDSNWVDRESSQDLSVVKAVWYSLIKVDMHTGGQIKSGTEFWKALSLRPGNNGDDSLDGPNVCDY